MLANNSFMLLLYLFLDCSGVPHCSSCHNPDIECRLCDAGKIPSETENGCDGEL